MTASADSHPDLPRLVLDPRDRAPELPVVELDSAGPLPPLPDPAADRPHHPAIPPGDNSDGQADPAAAGVAGMFWFQGDVLLCACPDCSAPMTVRLWLLVADCWRCETSIELTEQQERAAQRAWEQRARGPQPAAPVTQPGADREPAATTPQRSAVASVTYVPVPSPAAPEPRIRHQPADPPRANPRPRRRASRPVGLRVSRGLNDLLKHMPAWLISLLFHIVLLTILGLLSSHEDPGPYITLSTRISRVVREGGDTRLIQPSDNSVFDLGVPEGIDLDDPALRRAMVRADQDARQLRLTDPYNPALPDLNAVHRQIQSGPRSLAVRDPRVRVDMVRREGGTTLTEAAVARGLRWLADHQNSDGSWSLDDFRRAARCNCGHGGSITSDTAATALVLLPFLGAGQTHLTGIYRDTVAKGLRWLLEQQESNGDLRGSLRQYPGMYAQGQATIVLCESFLMTGDEQLRLPAQKAIDFIVRAQYTDGGWRYYPSREAPKQEGDTSVLGWQLMALQSALAADLFVPEETLENARNFLDQVSRAEGALYAYLPRENEHSAPMTAEGLLCRIYLGWKQNHPALRTGVYWMLENEPPTADNPNIYYWYYATQTLHHYGGTAWQRWNLQMRDVLVSTQETRGHAAGSWRPEGPLTSQGGRIYMTALAICCLEVYYRHLPIFRQIDLQ